MRAPYRQWMAVAVLVWCFAVFCYMSTMRFYLYYLWAMGILYLSPYVLRLVIFILFFIRFLFIRLISRNSFPILFIDLDIERQAATTKWN